MRVGGTDERNLEQVGPEGDKYDVCHEENS